MPTNQAMQQRMWWGVYLHGRGGTEISYEGPRLRGGKRRQICCGLENEVIPRISRIDVGKSLGGGQTNRSVRERRRMLSAWEHGIRKSHCWGLGLGAGERGLRQARRLRAKGELSLKCQAESLTTFPPKPRNIQPNIPKSCSVSHVSTRMWPPLAKNFIPL